MYVAESGEHDDVRVHSCHPNRTTGRRQMVVLRSHLQVKGSMRRSASSRFDGDKLALRSSSSRLGSSDRDGG